jgi:hypothetical protein
MIMHFEAGRFRFQSVSQTDKQSVFGLLMWSSVYGEWFPTFRKIVFPLRLRNQQFKAK